MKTYRMDIPLQQMQTDISKEWIIPVREETIYETGRIKILRTAGEPAKTRASGNRQVMKT